MLARRLGLLALAAGGAACGLGLAGTGAIAISDAGANDAGLDGARDAARADAAGDAAGGGGDADADAGFDAGPYATRVTSDLLAFYDFEEDGGAVVHDAVSPPLDVTIAKPTDVTWIPHALSLDAYTIVTSSGNFDKALAPCSASNEVTVEAWTVPQLVTEDDYGRIVTFASSDTSRNFALGTYKQKQVWVSMRDGEDVTPGPKFGATMQHIVLTRTSDKTLHAWLNGAEIGTRASSGDIPNWTSWPLTFGNAPTGAKGYQGELHLVAIYSRALTASEIQQNFAAGADPP